MPTHLQMHATTVVNEKIYVIGGQTVATVWVYDPASDTWTTQADLSMPRRLLTAKAIDGRIYAIGGASGASDNIGLATVEVFDTGLGATSIDALGWGGIKALVAR